QGLVTVLLEHKDVGICVFFELRIFPRGLLVRLGQERRTGIKHVSKELLVAGSVRVFVDSPLELVGKERLEPEAHLWGTVDYLPDPTCPAARHTGDIDNSL